MDSLARDHVLPLCHTLVLGQTYYAFKPTTDSTNADISKLDAQGAPHGALVVADCQTAGKGRNMRQWHSPPAVGIYVSLLLRPRILPLCKAPLIGLASAVAGALAIEKVAGIRPEIKWPNDLLLNERKVAGILMESHPLSDGSYSAVVGFGINVNTAQTDLPDRTRFPATSIRIESGLPVSRPALLAAWLDFFETAIETLEQGQSERILAQWQSYAYRIHRPVSLLTPAGLVTGTLLGTDPDGALLLQTHEGKTVPILSGDLLP